MTITKEKTFTNSLRYPELKVEGFTPMKNFILLAWEEAHDEFQFGGLSLVRPEPLKGRHYTGVVLACGPQVSDEIEVGFRVLFEQFCGFEKYFDSEWGRLALIKEENALAIVPPRTKLESGEDDFNYDA